MKLTSMEFRSTMSSSQNNAPNHQGQFGMLIPNGETQYGYLPLGTSPNNHPSQSNGSDAHGGGAATTLRPLAPAPTSAPTSPNGHPETGGLPLGLTNRNWQLGLIHLAEKIPWVWGEYPSHGDIIPLELQNCGMMLASEATTIMWSDPFKIKRPDHRFYYDRVFYEMPDGNWITWEQSTGQCQYLANIELLDSIDEQSPVGVGSMDVSDILQLLNHRESPQRRTSQPPLLNATGRQDKELSITPSNQQDHDDSVTMTAPPRKQDRSIISSKQQHQDHSASTTGQMKQDRAAFPSKQLYQVLSAPPTGHKQDSSAATVPSEQSEEIEKIEIRKIVSEWLDTPQDGQARYLQNLKRSARPRDLRLHDYLLRLRQKREWALTLTPQDKARLTDENARGAAFEAWKKSKAKKRTPELQHPQPQGSVNNVIDLTGDSPPAARSSPEQYEVAAKAGYKRRQNQEAPVNEKRRKVERSSPPPKARRAPKANTSSKLPSARSSARPSGRSQLPAFKFPDYEQGTSHHAASGNRQGLASSARNTPRMTTPSMAPSARPAHTPQAPTYQSPAYEERNVHYPAGGHPEDFTYDDYFLQNQGSVQQQAQSYQHAGRLHALPFQGPPSDPRARIYQQHQEVEYNDDLLHNQRFVQQQYPRYQHAGGFHAPPIQNSPGNPHPPVQQQRQGIEYNDGFYQNQGFVPQQALMSQRQAGNLHAPSSLDLLYNPHAPMQQQRHGVEYNDDPFQNQGRMQQQAPLYQQQAGNSHTTSFPDPLYNPNPPIQQQRQGIKRQALAQLSTAPQKTSNLSRPHLSSAYSTKMNDQGKRARKSAPEAQGGEEEQHQGSKKPRREYHEQPAMSQHSSDEARKRHEMAQRIEQDRRASGVRSQTLTRHPPIAGPTGYTHEHANTGPSQEAQIGSPAPVMGNQTIRPQPPIAGPANYASEHANTESSQEAQISSFPPVMGSQTIRPQIPNAVPTDDGSTDTGPPQLAPYLSSFPAIGSRAHHVTPNTTQLQNPVASFTHASGPGNPSLPTPNPLQTPVDASLDIVRASEIPFQNEPVEADFEDHDHSNETGTYGIQGPVDETTEAFHGYGNLDNPADIISGKVVPNVDPRFIYPLPPGPSQTGDGQASGAEAPEASTTASEGPGALAPAAPALASATAPGASYSAPVAPTLAAPASAPAPAATQGPPPFMLPPGVEPDTPAATAAWDAWLCTHFVFDEETGEI
ncbi:MAG: hypothetical protein Q9174_003863, partial [Haloplaca sp. 1 TL-2023]